MMRVRTDHNHKSSVQGVQYIYPPAEWTYTYLTISRTVNYQASYLYHDSSQVYMLSMGGFEYTADHHSL